MAEHYSQLIIAGFSGVFGTIGCGLVGKIVWDWLKNNRKPQNNPVPRAAQGFLTLTDIQGLCSNQKEACTKLMKAEFKVIKTEIKARLDQGDQQFESIDERIGGLEKRLDGQGQTLSDINTALQEIAENGGKKDVKV